MSYLINNSFISTNTNATNDVEQELLLDPIIPSSPVQFWTFLIFQIPSLACTIFLLFHLLFDRKLRTALHNHIIIILLLLTLCIEIFDNPLYVDAYRLGGYRNSFPMTPSICLMWWLIDYGFYGAISVFLAWGSFERHILIFHQQLLRTQKQKFFIHYLPLIIISIYIFGFYIFVIYFPPCVNTFDYTSPSCGSSPCYEDIPFLNSWDYIVNEIICTFLETIFSIGLLVRVLIQKRRIRQPISWRKHQKMAFQILSMSFLSLTIIFPQSLIFVVRQVGGENMNNFASGVDPYFFYLYTFVVFLLPFTCLSCLPEVWPKFLFFKSKQAKSAQTRRVAYRCESQRW
ncbi:unnamed protein product [Adineta steineri]|uniref:Uncharacterized protein n=1 Tax=Adineta steineri TaxID=433720 RepID=A0A819RQ19_9BILA|nr:unnamed protein product [Adineta steineri]CAF4045728.1 unnamed protein product [Adineta steineri]